MKRPLIISLIFVFVGMAFAQITPDLQNRMDQISNSQYIPVIVSFQDRFDVDQIISTHNLQGDVRSQAIEILKGKAETAHLWVKNYCEQRGNEVRDFKSFWIANMVAFKATAAVIREIAQHQGIDEIYLDEEQMFLDYKEGVATRDAWGLDKIKSKEVNKTYKGKNVMVAVIDTGVNYDHNDLLGRVVKGKDCYNNDMDPMDDHGHGSHCAGTVAGTTFGVAPEATILAVKVLSGGGSGSWQNVADGVQYVADYNVDGKKVDVASMSLGGRAPIQQVLRDAFDNAVKLGVSFSIAAGNSGSSPKTIGTPGDQKDICSIGATDINDNIAYFSSRGPVVAYGEPYYIKPDVSAPGVNITSCWKGTPTATNTISGTSMATPHVAGLMALMLEAKPGLNFETVRQILESTALDLGGPGKDNTYGSGRIDAVKAIQATLTIADTGRFDIEQEVTFPINPDGSIVVSATKENPLWTMSVAVNITIIEPAGTYSGTFTLIKSGKPTQTGELKNVPSGQLYYVGTFTVYYGNNTLELKGNYTGSSNATQGKLVVKAQSLD